MRIVQALLIALCISMTAYAQGVTIGIKAGARLTKDLDSNLEAVSESRSYTLGPALDVTLWRGFGVEFDVLYKRLGKSEFHYFLGTSTWSRDRSKSFEFPILAKYRLRKSAGPYVSGGYAFRHISGSGTTEWISTFSPTQSGSSTYATHYQNSSGLVLGGGMEFGMWHLRVSPEFRYTRWLTGGLRDNGPRGYFAASEQNQAEILVGIGWSARSR